MVIENNVQIIRLLPEAAPVFREIRLQSLKDHPEAFGASWIDEQAEDISVFADRLTRCMVLGAFVDDLLMGVVGFMRETPRKTQHKGILWGMYVREEARGQGLGALLIDHLLDYAGTVVEQVHLTVVSPNESARRLYERKGFHVYGTEPNALCIDGVYYDELLMVKTASITNGVRFQTERHQTVFRLDE